MHAHTYILLYTTELIARMDVASSKLGHVTIYEETEATPEPVVQFYTCTSNNVWDSKTVA